MQDQVNPVAVKSNQSSGVGLEAQPYSQDKIDEKFREIKELKDRDQPEKPKENPLKPDDSKQAIMMLALCALCIIGAIATGGVLAQVIAVGAAATGLFGLKKAKDAIFPPGALIEKKVKSAHEKVIDTKLKELKNIVEFQKGFERGKDGGAMDPDYNEREARKGNYFKTAIPELPTQEFAGFNRGDQDRKQREQQLQKDQSGQQETSLEERIRGLERTLRAISSEMSKPSVARPVEQDVRERDRIMPDQFRGANPALLRRVNESVREPAAREKMVNPGPGAGGSRRAR